MAIDTRVSEALRTHIALEQYAYALYTEIANFADRQGFSGLAKWADGAAAEELEHAKMFIDYLRKRAKVKQLAIAEPPEVADYLKALTSALEAENNVWKSLGDICAICKLEGVNDDATDQLCGDWILTEQVPSVKFIEDRIRRLARVMGTSGGVSVLDLLDAEMF